MAVSDPWPESSDSLDLRALGVWEQEPGSGWGSSKLMGLGHGLPTGLPTVP